MITSRFPVHVRRLLCTLPKSELPKSVLEQNKERARQYLERYSSPPQPSTTLPIKKLIPIVTGPSPDAPTLASILENEHGATNVATLDVRAKAPFTDWLILCCGKTERHVLAIADGIKHDLRKADVRVDGELVGICGREDADWMAVDVGEVVVHVMTEEARERYDLEGLWGEGGEWEREKDALDIEDGPKS